MYAVSPTYSRVLPRRRYARSVASTVARRRTLEETVGGRAVRFVRSRKTRRLERREILRAFTRNHREISAVSNPDGGEGKEGKGEEGERHPSHVRRIARGVPGAENRRVEPAARAAAALGSRLLGTFADSRGSSKRASPRAFPAR